ncbi:hypothetical protein DS901_14535 [Loktanella sp. D2R18]|uniref:hypothetical protein n=1 Tax=Rhodobacterales TaxID=204455 RepID=UPI000DE8926E|nr:MULTISPECIES: hypothetical protein [Rhodobacterales]MDO6588814.1 hypothetical protein [Yoonia sp. 1_MG-2023]RBW41957.1 hypothetical protein DS901_14535 [Loktanella sp. D2R18]
MSNTARTGNVDDALLKSVRNLVSVRTGEEPAPSGVVERLVLTPALRVDTHADASEAAVTPEIEDESTFRHADEVSKILVLDSAKRSERAGLEATIAELEAAVTSQAEDWEADEGENLDETEWAAAAFQSRLVDSSSLAEYSPIMREALGLEQDVADAGSPAVGIDEEALRGLVVEIVHQELSGELGERITRNVRKLVRREINRVLVSKGLD